MINPKKSVFNWKIWLYQFKNHFDIGSGEIVWVTGKSVQLMGLLYIFDYLGIHFSKLVLMLILCLSVILIPLFGLFWRKTKMWDSEMYVNASNNPVQKEMLLAARKINDSRRL